MKRCSRCAEVKSVAHFPPSTSTKDGLYAWCHDCHSLYQRARSPNRRALDNVRNTRRALKEAGLKKCARCATIRPFAEFYGDSRHTDGKQSHCAACFSYTGRAQYLKSNYGLTEGDVLVMVRHQNGVCPICRKSLEGRKMAIDHSHTDHTIRGVLHDYCNSRILPLVEWRGLDVERAREYLKEPPAYESIGRREVPETNQARRKVLK